MGYYTWYNIAVVTEDDKKRKVVEKEIAKAIWGEDGNLEDLHCGFESKSFDADADLPPIAKRHPDVMIEVYGDGSDSDDIWTARYRGEESETVRFSGLDDFKDILTPSEAERIFIDARKKYWEALLALRQAARRRIHDVKLRICDGHEDCFLDISGMDGDDTDYVTIIAKTGIGEAERHIVFGFLSDNKKVLTDEGLEISLDDISPDSLRDLVCALENLERDIDQGIIICDFNEENDACHLLPFDISTDEQ